MLFLWTQTSFNFYCLAEEEKAELSSGSQHHLQFQPNPSHTTFITGRMSEAKDTAGNSDPRLSFAVLAGRQTSFLFVCKQSQSELEGH